LKEEKYLLNHGTFGEHFVYVNRKDDKVRIMYELYSPVPDKEILQMKLSDFINVTHLIWARAPYHDVSEFYED
jgi:N6-adenosine-specific RNA methylase IME4